MDGFAHGQELCASHRFGHGSSGHPLLQGIMGCLRYKKTANVGCLRFFNVFFSNPPSVVTRSNGLKKNRKRVKNKELEY